MLFQKIEEASDLSQSFKFEVEAMLRHSHFVIEETSNGVELKVKVIYS